MKIKIGPFPNHRFYHNWLYNWFGYSPKQKTSIRIDNYDTWSMDHTLAPIILPMLVQLKATKHGAPMVDMEDVPREYTKTINPNNFRIDMESLERVNIIKNVGARNIFKVLTANFVKCLKNKEEFVSRIFN